MTRGDDRGSVVETVLLLPVFVALLLLVLAAGRVGSARSDVVDAARAGARQASYGASVDQVEAVVRDALDLGSVRCRGTRTDVAYDRAAVRVTVACEVGLEDMAGLPLPSSATVSASAVEPVDWGRRR